MMQLRMEYEAARQQCCILYSTATGRTESGLTEYDTADCPDTIMKHRGYGLPAKRAQLAEAACLYTVCPALMYPAIYAT